MSRGTSFGDEQFRGATDTSTFQKGTVFAIMPFSGAFDDVYSAIKDECKKLHLTSTRVDETTGSGFILKKIFTCIEEAEFIVVDLTEERPNVYYELGYAHGVGNEENDILLIAQTGTKLHFDIASLSVQFYSSTENLRNIIQSHLKQMIRLTR